MPASESDNYDNCGLHNYGSEQWRRRRRGSELPFADGAKARVRPRCQMLNVQITGVSGHSGMQFRGSGILARHGVFTVQILCFFQKEDTICGGHCDVQSSFAPSNWTRDTAYESYDVRPWPTAPPLSSGARNSTFHLYVPVTIDFVWVVSAASPFLVPQCGVSRNHG